MKNITEFNKFKNYKKLYEEAPADPRVGAYGGGGDTYFANVKGNFAGADQTLVGSAVIKLFRFVKRKGLQALLYTWFKPNLYREYMTGLLRYIVKNELNLPKAKELYDAIYFKDVQGNNLEKEVKLKIKFIQAEGESSEKTYQVLKVGSFVKNESDESVKDGYYKLVNYDRIIKVEQGKISELDSVFEAPKEDTGEKEPEQKGEVQIDKDILDYINKIKLEYSKGKVSSELATKINSDIDSLIKFFTESINEMKELITDDNKMLDEIMRIEKDLVVYEANKKSLINLKEEINKKVTEPEKQPVTPISKKEPVTVESILYEEVEITGVGGEVGNIGRKVGQIKTGDKKVTKHKRIGDELNQLSQVDIDLEDPEFVKQFDNPEIKKSVTNVVLEGKPEIIKIQLGAERLYMEVDDKGNRVPDYKLQNNWFKMVESIKNQFSKFMLTDLIDPINLVKGLSEDDKKKLEGKGSTLSVVTDVEDALKISENSKLNSLLQAPSKFSDFKEGNFGIINLQGSRVVFNLNTMDINKKKYYTYRVVASVLTGMTEDKTSSDFSSYISRNLPAYFTPKKQVSGGLHYIATFIIGKNEHLSTNSSNNVNIIFMYSRNKDLNELNKNTIKDCYFYFKTKDGGEKELKSESGNIVDKDATVSLSVGSPWLIKPAYNSKFGLNENDTKLTLKDLYGEKEYNLSQLRKF